MHILLDLDGTLTDPSEGIGRCIRHALKKLHIDIPPDINLDAFIGPPLMETFIKLCESTHQAEQALIFYRERFSTVGLFENELYPAIPASLNKLQEQALSINVATSKPTVYAKRIVEHFGLSQYIGEVFGSNLDGSLTDKTELLAHILKQNNFDPKQTVMIGDRSYDITGARNNKVQAIGVLWGYGSANELNHAGAESLCDHPSQLAQIIFPQEHV